jgi:hypothetical protein
MDKYDIGMSITAALVLFTIGYFCFYPIQSQPAKECSRAWIESKVSLCSSLNTGCLANVQLEINRTCLNK